MQSNTLLTATLLLASCTVPTESQERDGSKIQWRGGRALEKELANIPDRALPLLLKIEVLRESTLAGENFPIRFVITNPNNLALRITKIGWERPWLFAATGGEVLRSLDRSGGLHAGGVIGPALGPGESATATVTMFPGSAILQTFFSEAPYTLRLCGAGVVEATAIEEPGCPMVTCKWESEEIQVPVRAPTTHERKAYQGLLAWNENHVRTREGIISRNRARGIPDSKSQEEWTLAMVDFHRKFLDEYGDTPFANQIRVLLLRDLVDLPRRKSGNDAEKLPPFFPLYVKTVLELLDAGVPYASKVDREVLETLCMARRWDLVVGVLDKLLAMNSSERTLDPTLASVSRDFGDLPRLQAKGYLSPGKETEDLEAVAVRCIERCAAWTGYRAQWFDRRTFAFLSDVRRWDLLELTAQRTIDVSGERQNCGTAGPSSQSKTSDETIAAAKDALSLAQRKQEKPQ